ncbi:hypothetical protein R6Q59_028115 [Mikania micrantha]
MSSRHDSRHADDDGGGAYSPYDVFEDRDSQFQRNKIREDNERSKTRERERDRDRGKDRDRRHKDHPERSGRDRKDDVRFRNRDHNRRHDYDRDKRDITDTDLILRHLIDPENHLDLALKAKGQVVLTWHLLLLQLCLV